MSDSPILVDDREGSKRLVTYACLRDITELTRLDSADVCMVGNGPVDPVLIGVEVKSIHDLISSMNTGRLQGTQLPTMVEYYQVRWLLVYGMWRPDRRGQLEIQRGNAWKMMRLGSRIVPYSYLESFLFDVETIGVSVKVVPDEGTAAQWLACLHRWWSKEWVKHKGLRAFDQSHEISLMPSMDAPMLVRAKVASKLPGLGFERATAAAKHFPSVTAMVNANVTEWMEVPGVGKVVAKAIVEAVR